MTLLSCISLCLDYTNLKRSHNFHKPSIYDTSDSGISYGFILHDSGWFRFHMIPSVRETMILDFWQDQWDQQNYEKNWTNFNEPHMASFYDNGRFQFHMIPSVRERMTLLWVLTKIMFSNNDMSERGLRKKKQRQISYFQSKKTGIFMERSHILCSISKKRSLHKIYYNLQPTHLQFPYKESRWGRYNDDKISEWKKTTYNDVWSILVIALILNVHKIVDGQ